jgi:hypothetical protein
LEAHDGGLYYPKKTIEALEATLMGGYTRTIVSAHKAEEYRETVVRVAVASVWKGSRRKLSCPEK